MRDVINKRVTVYEYDYAGRLVGVNEYSTEDYYYNTTSKLVYDEQTRLTEHSFNLAYTIDGTSYNATEVTSYGYDVKNRLSSVTVVSAGKTLTQSFVYDDFDRVSNKTYSSSGSFSNEISYGFAEDSFWQLETYTSKVENLYSDTTEIYELEYDHKGNITSITTSDGKVVSYEYDEIGQLTRENNKELGKTFVYVYNSAGNIESETVYSYTTSATLSSSQKIETNLYGYVRSANTSVEDVNATWRDILMSYGNVIFTYDEIGNPLTYYNGTSYTFGWEGRQLKSATRGSTSFSFTYNDEGIRTSKTVGGVEHTYILDGTQIVSEIWGSNIVIYLYDSDGAPIGMQHRFAGTSYTWETYWFEKNLQGDIIAIYSNDGTKILSYTYDAWGNHEVEYHVEGNNVAQYNPFRYRGYYYDEDLGMYYLQSRYYDPEIGRFINADGYVSTSQELTGYNMLAYCGNNPVNRKDPSGEFWVPAILVAAIFVVCIVALTGCSEESATPSDYVQENSTNQNCYSYAFDLPHSANPGDYSASVNSECIFAVQLNDGTWADKPGRTPSRWNKLDGTAIAWDLGSIKNYYNTETVYFAVER